MPAGRSSASSVSCYFPPAPHLRGRAAELRTLVARVGGGGAPRLALVGGGGSGKSVLAAALGHRLRPRFPGGVHWFRVGPWDATTLTEMLARRLGAPVPSDGGGAAALRAHLLPRPRTLVVLDNHENDRALARFLGALDGCPVVWLVTARRCLLSGVEIFPVTPPLATARGRAFPRVAGLTELLRWHPLALDLADRLVATGAVRVPELRRWLEDEGVARVSVMANEDDIPEVRLLVEWAWRRLPAAARRMLEVLASCEGDDVDAASLARLAQVRAGEAPLAQLRRLHLVQEPLAGRFAVHAVVREAVRRKGIVPAERFFAHYVPLLERQPDRIPLEQTHLFAAMDHAYRTSDLAGALRLQRLVDRLDAAR
jgi:hypothetical protein